MMGGWMGGCNRGRWHSRPTTSPLATLTLTTEWPAVTSLHVAFGLADDLGRLARPVGSGGTLHRTLPAFHQAWGKLPLDMGLTPRLTALAGDMRHLLGSGYHLVFLQELGCPGRGAHPNIQVPATNQPTKRCSSQS